MALCNTIIATAFEEVDSTPMDGFDADELDKIFGLIEKGLRSTLLLSLGYGEAEKNWLVNLKKIIRNNEELVTVIE